jgi:hypothetical protein
MSPQDGTPNDGFRPHPPEIPRKAADEPIGWMEDPKVIRLAKRASVVAVLALFVSDFFIHYHDYLGLVIGGTTIENVPGFYTVFGFVASVLLIFVSKGIGSSLKRKEGYYDDE